MCEQSEVRNALRGVPSLNLVRPTALPPLDPMASPRTTAVDALAAGDIMRERLLEALDEVWNHCLCVGCLCPHLFFSCTFGVFIVFLRQIRKKIDNANVSAILRATRGQDLSPTELLCRSTSALQAVAADLEAMQTGGSAIVVALHKLLQENVAIRICLNSYAERVAEMTMEKEAAARKGATVVRRAGARPGPSAAVNIGGSSGGAGGAEEEAVPASLISNA